MANLKVSEAMAFIKDEVIPKLTKSKGEILGVISKIENGDQELSPENVALVQQLRGMVKAQDDLIPDAPIIDDGEGGEDEGNETGGDPAGPK